MLIVFHCQIGTIMMKNTDEKDYRGLRRLKRGVVLAVLPTDGIGQILD